MEKLKLCQFIFCQIGKNWQKNIFIYNEIIVVKLALANYKNANYANLANLKFANANFYWQKINNTHYKEIFNYSLNFKYLFINY